MSHSPVTPTNVQYELQLADPAAHLFQVTLTLFVPDPQGQMLRMPAWIPGSYMIRDFARHVIDLQAKDEQGSALSVTKSDKSTWLVAPCRGPLVITYAVYAWDLSVRAAHFDQFHAYFNGTSVFVEAVGQGNEPCTLMLANASHRDATGWTVATSLTAVQVDEAGFGRYQAESYDDLIDHPVEIGELTRVSFTAGDVPHEIVLSGRHYADMARLSRDLQRICEYQINFFGAPAPMSRYLFLVWVVGDGYGGLEHRSSTSLICSRGDLPVAGMDTVSEGYRMFLGLCSHEYFHTWNVKRIKPAVFLPYQLANESHTELLWAFEGITSYYDDLFLLRCGLIDTSSYLELIGKTFTRIARNPGRFRQSVAESSFDAWTRFYKQDENAPNAIVSYYTKGSLLALGLDVLLRVHSQGTYSLDHLMRELWQDYGQRQRGVQDDTIQSLLAQRVPVAVDALTDYFNTVLYGREDYDFAALLARVGIGMHWRSRESAADSGGSAGKPGARVSLWLGASWTGDAAGIRLTTVLHNSPAHAAGLSAGDVIIALDGLRLDKDSLEKWLAMQSPDQCVRVHAFRADRLLETEIRLQSAPADTCYLTIDDPTQLTNWLPTTGE